MKDLSIGKKIAFKRKALGLTQEELAGYLGVSKPAVSKWESGQSYPDITLLPVLASYFNCSVDELLGYAPQLTKEKIKQIYLRFSKEASPETFSRLHEECRELCKKYYSCWGFLFFMGQWLINHVNLAAPSEAPALLKEALALYERVAGAGDDPVLARQAIIMQAYCQLGLGQPLEVIELLEGIVESPMCPEVLLAQAHQMRGNQKKAQEILQVALYHALLEMLNIFPSLTGLLIGDNERLDACVRRERGIADTFSVDRLHPSLQLSFDLCAASAYAMSGNKERALDVLEDYAALALSQKTYPLTLHGDSFFDQMDHYFQSLDLGTALPRSEATILQSLREALHENPAFACLQEEPRFVSVCRRMEHLPHPSSREE